MSNKNHLTLYIDNKLVNLAKVSNMNISNEFEQWLKVRLGQIHNDNEPIIDADLEIAKHEAEILKLRTKKEVKQDLEIKAKEEIMVIDNQIDNLLEFHEDLKNITEERIHGLQYLFQKKFNKVLNPLQAKELLENRIKERGLIGGLSQ
jgi:hypothetical protein